MTIKISLSIIGLLFIPLVIMQRDYFAIGGEIFLPKLLPFLLLGLVGKALGLLWNLKGKKFWKGGEEK